MDYLHKKVNSLVVFKKAYCMRETKVSSAEHENYEHPPFINDSRRPHTGVSVAFDCFILKKTKFFYILTTAVDKIYSIINIFSLRPVSLVYIRLIQRQLQWVVQPHPACLATQ